MGRFLLARHLALALVLGTACGGGPGPTPAPTADAGTGSSTYDQTVLSDHPVAFWAMNKVPSDEPDLSGNGSPLNIGTMATDTWFPGAVGRVAIYDHLLSQAQITNHYRVMTGQQPTGSCGSTCTF